MYGCGDPSQLNSRGLAVVGSRHVDDELVDYTRAVGTLAAQSGKTIVSGGAKGIDQAAMHGALDAGGRAVGILGDSLEKAVLARYNRDKLLSKQLTLVSPYDPAAGFNVGNAMRRNKFIYALSNASLVVSSDFEKGGTWAGAIEQLTKLKHVAVYVRSTGPESLGLDALKRRGACPWPNPTGIKELEVLLDSADTPAEEEQPGLPFTENDGVDDNNSSGEQNNRATEARATAPGAGHVPEKPVNQLAEELFRTVRELVRSLASKVIYLSDVARTLDVTDEQAELWIARLLEEGVIESMPAGQGFIATMGS